MALIIGHRFNGKTREILLNTYVDRIDTLYALWTLTEQIESDRFYTKNIRHTMAGQTMRIQIRIVPITLHLRAWSDFK